MVMKTTYRCSFNTIQTLRCNEIRLVYFICNYTKQRCNVSVSWVHVSQTNKCKRMNPLLLTEKTIWLCIRFPWYIYIYMPINTMDICIIRSMSYVYMYIYNKYLIWHIVRNNFAWNKVLLCNILRRDDMLFHIISNAIWHM